MEIVNKINQSQWTIENKKIMLPTIFTGHTQKGCACIFQTACSSTYVGNK